MDKCEVNGCKSKPVYVLEWYGYNQFGKDPEVVQEIYVCKNFQHMIRLGEDDGPDGINEYERIPEGIVFADTLEDAPGVLEKLLDEIDPSRKQLWLFPKLKVA